MEKKLLSLGAHRRGRGKKLLQIQERRHISRLGVEGDHENKSTVGLIGSLLIAAALAMVAILVLTPSFRFQSENTEGAYLAYSLLAAFGGAVIVLFNRASRRPEVGWTLIAGLSGATNLLVVPWVICNTLRVPAAIAMPPMMLSFWATLAAAVMFVAIKLHRADPATVSKFVIGGSVGFAGFALLLTQFGTSASGYEAVVPLTPVAGQADLNVKSVADGETTITLRYDGGLVQAAYFDRGLLRVTRPAYFQHVDYTFSYETTAPQMVGRYHSSPARTYTDAMQSLATMGFVKQVEAGMHAQRSPE